MSNNSKNTTSSGICIGGLLGVLFIGLKLTGYIDWDWIWVVSPFWIPLAIAIGIVFVGLLIGFVAELFFD